MAARKEAGITQVELGKRLGQRQTFVSKIAEFVVVSRAIGTDPHAIIRAAETEGDEAYNGLGR